MRKPTNEAQQQQACALWENDVFIIIKVLVQPAASGNRVSHFVRGFTCGVIYC